MYVVWFQLFQYNSNNCVVLSNYFCVIKKYLVIIVLYKQF